MRQEFLKLMATLESTKYSNNLLMSQTKSHSEPWTAKPTESPRPLTISLPPPFPLCVYLFLFSLLSWRMECWFLPISGTLRSANMLVPRCPIHPRLTLVAASTVSLLPPTYSLITWPKHRSEIYTSMYIYWMFLFLCSEVNRIFTFFAQRKSI